MPSSHGGDFFHFLLFQNISVNVKYNPTATTPRSSRAAQPTPAGISPADKTAAAAQNSGQMSQLQSRGRKSTRLHNLAQLSDAFTSSLMYIVRT